MASTFYLAPSTNFVQTTLNGAINDSATTITLNSPTGIQAPGYAVINRQNSNGDATPNAREIIRYTGISGNDLTGVTRGADGSTARSHSDGAIVELTFTVGMWNSLVTIVSNALDGSGYLKAINSPVSIAIGQFTQFVTPSVASIARLEATQLVTPSTASIAEVNVATRINVSGASVTGIGFYPVFASSANYSGPTIAIGGVLRAPRAGTLQWVSVTTRYVVSTASIGVDFKIRDASVFANATTRPAIAAGGTYVSTASIATRNINQGDLISADIVTIGANGFVRQVTIQGGLA